MLTLSQAFRFYLVEHCKLEGISTTRATYAQKALEAFFGADREVETLKRADGREYRLKRLESGVADATIRRELGCLLAVLRHNAKEERIGAIPAIDLPADSAPVEQYLTEEQVGAILEMDMPPRIRLFMQIAFATAARAGAIEDLTWDRVDMERGTIDFRVPGKKATKKRRGVVPVANWLKPVLRAAFESRDPTDPLVIGKGPSTYRQVKALYKGAGIEGIRQPRHIARKTFATNAVLSGVPIQEVARVLADSITTTERRYSHFSPQHLKGAVNFRSNQP